MASISKDERAEPLFGSFQSSTLRPPHPRVDLECPEPKSVATRLSPQENGEGASIKGERLCQLLIELMNDGAVSILPNGRILYCNRRFAEMVETPLERVIGKTLGDFVEPARQKQFQGALDSLPPSGKKVELNLGLAGRSARPMLLSLHPHELQETRVISIVVTDLTERKSQEQRLRKQNAELERRVAERTTELKRSNEALDMATHKLMDNAKDLEHVISQRTLALQEIVSSLEQFCYTIAHDLRAPLRTMHGFSSALLEDFAASLHPTAVDYARRIVRAAARMDDQIRALLAYGRLNSADMPLTTTNLGTLLTEVSQSEEFRAARISIRQPIPLVLANPTALRQVLDNLIGNAVKFVAPGVSPEVRISAQEAAGWVRLTIQDNGIGIDPKYHQRIFRVFERVSTHDYPGTGIGLAIVQKGVDRMGGRVGVESLPGHGSRFWVDLRGVTHAPH